MSNEKPQIKKEIFWDEHRAQWRDWLGNVWSVPDAVRYGKSVVEDSLLAAMLATCPRPFPVYLDSFNPGTTAWFLAPMPEDAGTYVFRGKIDLDHLVADCRSDDRLGFIAITPKETYVGALSGVIKDSHPPGGLINSTDFTSEIDGYMIYEIDKKKTPGVVKWLPKAVEDYRKKIRKTARKIKKKLGKLSKEPETKVMAY